MSGVEYGVEWCRDDGSSYVGLVMNEQAARHLVHVGRRGFSPSPVRVVKRECGPWHPADDDGA